MRRICPSCMGPFEAGGPRRIFCSPACKLADWKKRQQLAPSPLRAASYAAGTVTRNVPAVHTGDDSKTAIDEATASLGSLRALKDADEPGSVLHLLASLAAEIEIRLPAVVAESRRHGYSWEEIRAVSGMSSERAKRLVDLHARAGAAVARRDVRPPADMEEVMQHNTLGRSTGDHLQ